MIRLTHEEAASWLTQRLRGKSGRVFVQGGASEPLALAENFVAEPDLAAGLTFVGAFIPGVNRTDWAGLHPDARAEGTFASADWRASLESGRFALRPLSYFQTWGWLAATPLDAAVVQVSPPDARGLCALGVTADFAGAVLGRGVPTLAYVNAAMPACGPKVPLEAFEGVVELERPLLEYDAGTLDPAFARIAERIAELTPEGATLEFGVGKVGLAALSGLKGRRGLKVHTGMVTDALIETLDSGAVDSAVTAMALGSRALYERCGSDRRIRLEPVSFTHDARVLAAIPRFVAVNSVLEVDLFGQANAEFIDGRAVSGVGGLVDFLRGAAASDGGVPVVALNATARGGSVSRIVPRLAPGAVSVARQDMGVVVTEYGAADLRGLSLDGRAQALIGVAAPEHRGGLSDAWDEMRRAM